MTITRAQVNELLEKAGKATPGPWQPLSSVAEGGDMSDTYFIKAQPHPAMRGFTKDIAMVEGEANTAHIAACDPGLITSLCRAFIEKDQALGDLIKRIDFNGGIGEYKGGPPFAMTRARAAYTGDKP